jgi:hypothetical protein
MHNGASHGKQRLDFNIPTPFATCRSAVILWAVSHVPTTCRGTGDILISFPHLIRSLWGPGLNQGNDHFIRVASVNKSKEIQYDNCVAKCRQYLCEGQWSLRNRTHE